MCDPAMVESFARASRELSSQRRGNETLFWTLAHSYEDRRAPHKVLLRKRADVLATPKESAEKKKRKEKKTVEPGMEGSALEEHDAQEVVCAHDKGGINYILCSKQSAGQGHLSLRLPGAERSSVTSAGLLLSFYEGF